MLQSWKDLYFLHYSIEPEMVQALLPKGLTVDTFGGKAWVGLVPFWMTNIRFPWLPAVPGAHTFPETNVRTYVHREGKEPGVWFFSLDAANLLAVWWARRFFSLPYHFSEMTASEGSYSSRRRDGNAAHDLRFEIQSELPEPEPGSLEFFLIERYLLYSVHRERLFTGLVYHEPYPLFGAKLLSGEETMLAATGLPQRPWEHVCYSPGVSVEVFGIQEVARASRPWFS
jgi:uncharacterized protein